VGRVFLVPFLLPISSCGADQIEPEAASPDDELKATWFTRDGGATTDFSTIVDVHRSYNAYLVPLDPDVRRVFRSEKAVNDALRLVIELRKVSGGSARSRSGV
jgi:hypothetical protein